MSGGVAGEREYADERGQGDEPHMHRALGRDITRERSERSAHDRTYCMRNERGTEGDTAMDTANDTQLGITSRDTDSGRGLFLTENINRQSSLTLSFQIFTHQPNHASTPPETRPLLPSLAHLPHTHTPWSPKVDEWHTERPLTHSPGSSESLTSPAARVRISALCR